MKQCQEGDANSIQKEIVLEGDRADGYSILTTNSREARRRWSDLCCKAGLIMSNMIGFTEPNNLGLS